MKYAARLHAYLTSENSVALQSSLVAMVAMVISSLLLMLTYGFVSVPEIDDSSPTTIDLVSVVLLAPLIETVLLVLSLEFFRLLIGRPVAVAVLVALGWAAAHSSVRLTWGIGVVAFFLIASYLYLHWRSRSHLRAVQLLLFPHMLINLTACGLWWATA
ncbi:MULTISPECIES: hypothetical protein [Pseudomonas]|uniref:hypothetical protein n=1 Tax=Pseudomonas TaxID=286 RepID=UPI0023D85DF8|nr:hypothetical protein [Pseudomonas sp. 273]